MGTLLVSCRMRGAVCVWQICRPVAPSSTRLLMPQDGLRYGDILALAILVLLIILAGSVSAAAPEAVAP